MASTTGAEPRVSIRVVPHAAIVDQAIRVTCRVPRNPDNRMLEVSVANYESSQRQLDGDESLITHEFLFPHIPCESDTVTCAVRTVNRRDAVAQVPLIVFGCDQ